LKVSKFNIINDVEKLVKDQYTFLTEQNERIDNMYEDYNDLLEYRKVIEVSQSMLHGEEFRGLRRQMESVNDSSKNSDSCGSDPEECQQLFRRPSVDSEVEVLNLAGDEGVQVGRVVGTCMNSDLLRLKRMLFRATRGNALVISKSEGGIETYDKKEIPKSVFIVIFQEGGVLRERIEKITQNFSKNKYNLPKGGLQQKLMKINERVEQTRQLIVMSIVGMEKYLHS